MSGSMQVLIHGYPRTRIDYIYPGRTIGVGLDSQLSTDKVLELL